MNNLLSFLNDYVIFMNITFLIIIILLERKNPLFTLFWITLLVLAPYFGFIGYLFFGLSFRKKRVVNEYYKWKFLYSKKVMGFSHYKELVKWEQLISYVEISSKNRLISLNTSKIFIDGENFFSALKNDLKNAKKSISMEYYIFRDDNLGREIANILLEKVKEGVEIKIIVDGAGGYGKKMLKELQKFGIETGVFFPSHFPLFKIANLRANYRDHRKLCIIDSKYGYISGFNIGDEYLGKGKLGYWRDTGLRIFGEACIELEKEFFFSWGIVKKKKIEFKKEYEYNAEVLKELIEVKGKHSGHMQVVSSGPNYQFRTIRDNALKLIMKAQKYIYIQTPYFVPDDTILDALKIAALSGVNIKIMIPDKPDHFFIYWVNQYFCGELLDLGVEIYKYKKGFLHSKFIVVDDEVVTVGTANFDYRSFYQNFEINVNIYEKDVAKTFRDIFHNDQKFSHKLLRSEYSKRGYYIKLKESICRLLAPIM